LGIGGPASSERYVEESWTVRDGLPVNSVSALLQGRDGYLWLATHDGLVRFDGVRFTVFNAANAPGLPSNRIALLTQARDGTLWLQTEQYQLVRYRRGAFAPVGWADGVRAHAVVLCEDARGTMWVGTGHGLFVVHDTLLVPVVPGAIRGRVTAIVAADEAAHRSSRMHASSPAASQLNSSVRQPQRPIPKQAKTAAQFLADLEADPVWRAARDQREREHARRAAALAEDERELVAEIRAVGYDVDSVYDLVNNSPHPILPRRFLGPYPGAYAALLGHLRVPHATRIREGIIRALTVRDGGTEVAAALLDELRRESDPALRWVLANALRTAMPYRERCRIAEIAEAVKSSGPSNRDAAV
jgi:hypothetical protein